MTTSCSTTLVGKPKMVRRLMLLGSLLASLFVLSACQSEQLQSFSGRTMGTQYNITVVANEVEAGLVARKIASELGDFSDIFSTYIRDSEINRLSDAPAGQWLEVSDHMYQLLAQSLSIAEQTDGAFDPTIRPLVDLWGFGPLQRPDQVPDSADIVQALAEVDWRSVQLEDGKLYKSQPLGFDLSAIAKGYGVDVIAQILESSGIERYLVEVGGEMRLAGLKPNAEQWKIAIETPAAVVRQAYKVIQISNIGLATSGDYRNYFENDGKRYSHTIDPRTGYPIGHSMASVTVLAASSAQADAWATAMEVAGPDTAMQWAEEKGLAVFMIIRQEGEFVDRMSTAFTEVVN